MQPKSQLITRGDSQMSFKTFCLLGTINPFDSFIGQLFGVLVNRRAGTTVASSCLLRNRK
jgi:hypothetical protein